MSLKHFHIAFIAVSSLFCIGLGAWCLLVEGLPAGLRAMGWLSFVGAAGLVVYGVRFYKKLRNFVH